MSQIIVIESGMNFIMDDEYAFRIEKDPYVENTQGLKSCEFVVWNDQSVTLVEAKTSLSNPENRLEDFNKNIRDVTDKFTNSLQLFVASYIGRFKNDGKMILPVSANNIDWTAVKIEFYLVIKTHQKAWLPPVNEALKKELKQLMKCWNINDSSLKVINEQMALDRGMIVP